MAKSYKSSRSSSGSAILTVIVTLVIVAVLAAAACCAGFASRGADGKWFQNGDLASWHWTDKADKPAEGDDQPGGTGDELNNYKTMVGTVTTLSGNTSGELLSKSVGVGMAFNARQTTASNAYTLSVVMQPENVSDKRCTWAAKWVNPEAEWAQGKNVNDYVSVPTTPAEEVNVTFKQAFGEKIAITAASILDSKITATCTVNYARRIESYYIAYDMEGQSSTAEYGTTNPQELVYNYGYTGPGNIGFFYVAQLSESYTIDKITDTKFGGVNSNGIRIKMTDELREALYARNIPFTSEAVVMITYDIYPKLFKLDLTANKFKALCGWTEDSAYRQAYYEAFAATEKHFYFETSISNGYGQTLSKNYEFRINPDSIAVNPSSAEIDPGEIVV